MSTLEKFGILVILILVVIIGVVAVWGVGGAEEGINPFGGEGLQAKAPAGNPVPPPSNPLPWPDAGVGRNTVPPATGPVVAPPVKDPITPPVPVSAPKVSLAPTPRTHTVQSGETLSALAQKYYGDKSKWQDIQKANAGLDPRTLRVGQVVVIPESGASVAARPAPKTPPVKGMFESREVNPDDGPSLEPRTPALPPGGGREYEVRKGDTLSAIAAEFFGSASKWHRLIEANPGLDPQKLRPGMRITIPAAE